MTTGLFDLQEQLARAVGLDILQLGHGIEEFTLNVKAGEFPRLEVTSHIYQSPGGDSPGRIHGETKEVSFRLVPDEDFEKVRHLLDPRAI